MGAMHLEEFISEMCMVFIYFRPISLEIPGGYSTKFYTGRLRLEVQSLIRLYTIYIQRKGTPFVYLQLKKGTHYT